MSGLLHVPVYDLLITVDYPRDRGRLIAGLFDPSVLLAGEDDDLQELGVVAGGQRPELKAFRFEWVWDAEPRTDLLIDLVPVPGTAGAWHDLRVSEMLTVAPSQCGEVITLHVV